MPRLFVRILLILATFGGCAGIYAGWNRHAARKSWAAVRPSVPERGGDRAPGLDDRLAACAARFNRWPVDRPALAEFARVCHANGKLEEAAAGYRALIQLDPVEPRWPRLLASILAGYGQLDEAIPLLRRTTTLAPAYVPAWLKLGDALLKSNETSEAAAAYRAALTRDPGNQFALLGLARCDIQDNRLTSARSNLQKAVADHPDFATAQSLLATVFDRLGNPDAAKVAQNHVERGGHYTEAPDPWLDDLITECHDPYMLLIAASAALADGKSAAAFPLLRRGIELSPNNAPLHRQLAKTHLAVGELLEARNEMDKAVALDPANEAIRLDQLSAIRQVHDDAALETAVTRGLASCPHSAALHYEAGLRATKSLRWNEAEAHFKFAWQNRPDQTAAALELAKVYFRSGQRSAAIALLEGDLLARYPQSGEGWLLLVREGIEAHDPRAAGWLQRASDLHLPGAVVAEMRGDFQRRFNPGSE